MQCLSAPILMLNNGTREEQLAPDLPAAVIFAYIAIISRGGMGRIRNVTLVTCIQVVNKTEFRGNQLERFTKWMS